MTSPRVSVVIATYGHAELVLEAVQSVFAQTFGDHETIVVNDGSPDDTAARLQPLVDAGRIRYVEQRNQGPAAARNAGLALARGDYVAVLDDDDVWPSDRLEWQVGLLEAEPDAIVVYGQAQVVGGGGADEIVPPRDGADGDVFDAFVRNVWIRTPGQTLIRRAALDAVGGFDPDLWGVDDWDLWLRLARRGRFLYRPRVAVRHRRHDDNASRDFRRMYRNGMKVVRKHFGGALEPVSRGQRARARAFVRAFCVGDGLHEVRRRRDAGDHAGAMRAWFDLLRVDPTRVTHWRLSAGIAKHFGLALLRGRRS